MNKIYGGPILLQEHVDNCVSVKNVLNGIWPSPWAYLGTIEYRDRIGRLNQHGTKWHSVQCNYPQCSAKLIVSEDNILISLPHGINNDVTIPKNTKELDSKSWTVTYNNDIITKDAIIQKLLDFYMKHEAFSGESIMQCDNPQIEAAPLLADIAEVLFNFNVKWKD